MAKDIMDILGSKKTSLQGLVELLFKAQTESHITHILQRKRLLCEHNAMAAFYEEIEDLVDNIAEFSMAHGILDNFSVTVCNEISNTESYFENLYKEVETYRPGLNKYPFLISKLDDIQELISQTIYRLKFIQG